MSYSSGDRTARAKRPGGGSPRSWRSSGSSLNTVLAVGLLATIVAAGSIVVDAGRGARAAGSGPAVTQAAAPSTPLSMSWLGGHPQSVLDVHGVADVLVDVDARQVLWQRDAHDRRAPASLTKLMTAMVAADLASLDKVVTVTAATDVDAVRNVEPTSTVMGLTAGERLSVRDLMYGLFLRSGNDAAETLGGTLVPRARFIELMNQKAAVLHMADSHFTTPVGLDDPGLRTSAYDLAIAAATIATRYPALLAISGTPSITLPQSATHKAFAMTNYNKLVLPGGQYTYQGATGMKTAFTDDAGPCMIATATRGGRRLVAVVMTSDNFFVDATRLLDYGFAQRVKAAGR